MENKNTILSLFDYSGNWSKPYRENNFNVLQIELKLGINILKWDYKKDSRITGKVIGILAAVPCTDFALSGAKHFFEKDRDGRTAESIKLLNKTLEIIDYFKPDFWAIENPASRIHKMNLETAKSQKEYNRLGKPVLKFHPWHYAGHDPLPDKSRYNKQTWLWGNFALPLKKEQSPLSKEFPGFLKLGGKSEKTKELRSITPLGFSYAFYSANKGV